MAKNCIYCSTEIDASAVVDMCKACMHQVWGEKMSETIISNMQKEKDAGNLELGRVGEGISKEHSDDEEKIYEETHPLEKAASTQGYYEGSNASEGTSVARPESIPVSEPQETHPFEKQEYSEPQTPQQVSQPAPEPVNFARHQEQPEQNLRPTPQPNLGISNTHDEYDVNSPRAQENIATVALTGKMPERQHEEEISINGISNEALEKIRHGTHEEPQGLQNPQSPQINDISEENIPDLGYENEKPAESSENRVNFD